MQIVEIQDYMCIQYQQWLNSQLQEFPNSSGNSSHPRSMGTHLIPLLSEFDDKLPSLVEKCTITIPKKQNKGNKPENFEDFLHLPSVLTLVYVAIV